MGKPRGIGWGGRWEGGSGWGTHVNPWLFHFNVWQNPLQIKIKKKKKEVAWSSSLLRCKYRAFLSFGYSYVMILVNEVCLRVVKKMFSLSYIESVSFCLAPSVYSVEMRRGAVPSYSRQGAVWTRQPVYWLVQSRDTETSQVLEGGVKPLQNPRSSGLWISSYGSLLIMCSFYWSITLI